MPSNRRALLPLLLCSTLSALSSGCAEEEGGCPPAGLSRCDPIEQTCCEAGESCLLYYSGGGYIDTCLGAGGELTEGEPCVHTATSGASACAEGLTCVQVTGVDPQPVCRAICRSDEDCPSGACDVDLPGVGRLSACR